MMQEAALLDALLLGYATGELSGPQSLLVATLLAMRDDLRRRVRTYEGIGGRVLEEQSPAPVHPACLDAVWARIENADAPRQGASETAKNWQDMPEPLRRVLCGCGVLDAGGWHRLVPGVDRRALLQPRRTVFGREAPWQLSLMRLAPHTAVPAHRHSGVEIMLVLEGGYHDGLAAYGAGDVSIMLDPDVAHQPVADAEGCTCLVLTRGPLRFVRRTVRFLTVFIRN